MSTNTNTGEGGWIERINSNSPKAAFRLHRKIHKHLTNLRLLKGEEAEVQRQLMALDPITERHPDVYHDRSGNAGNPYLDENGDLK
jgi:hypothetical protein